MYLIKGISEDPISEGHAVIKLRTEKQHTDSILITNPYCEKLVFKVVTDLPELRFPPSVLLGPNEIIDFQVQV